MEHGSISREAKFRKMWMSYGEIIMLARRLLCLTYDIQPSWWRSFTARVESTTCVARTVMRLQLANLQIAGAINLGYNILGRVVNVDFILIPGDCGWWNSGYMTLKRMRSTFREILGFQVPGELWCHNLLVGFCDRRGWLIYFLVSWFANEYSTYTVCSVCVSLRWCVWGLNENYKWSLNYILITKYISLG